jgi:hypothetical protein
MGIVIQVLVHYSRTIGQKGQVLVHCSRTIGQKGQVLVHCSRTIGQKGIGRRGRGVRNLSFVKKDAFI